jgi:hypothetical protein
MCLRVSKLFFITFLTTFHLSSGRQEILYYSYILFISFDIDEIKIITTVVLLKLLTFLLFRCCFGCIKKALDAWRALMGPDGVMGVFVDINVYF